MEIAQNRCDVFKAVVAFNIPCVLSVKDPVVISLVGIHVPSLRIIAKEFTHEEDWDAEQFEQCLQTMLKFTRTLEGLNKSAQWLTNKWSETVFFVGHMHLNKLMRVETVKPKSLFELSWGDIVQVVWDAGENKGRSELFPQKPQKPRKDEMNEILHDWRYRCSSQKLPLHMMGITETGLKCVTRVGLSGDEDDYEEAQESEFSTRLNKIASSFVRV
jgi:hypothetical protein